MFSQAYVKNSIHGGRGVYPSIHWGRHPPPQVDTPLGRHPPPWAGTPEQTPLWADTPRADTPCPVHAGTHPTEMHSCQFFFVVNMSNHLCFPSGVGTYLKDKNPKIQVVLADPQVCTYVYRASLRQPRKTRKLTSVVDVVRGTVLDECLTKEQVGYLKVPLV